MRFIPKGTRRASSALVRKVGLALYVGSAESSAVLRTHDLADHDHMGIRLRFRSLLPVQLISDSMVKFLFRPN